MEITIKKLNEDLIKDYLEYFDQVAFSDNHEWAGCYCLYYHYASKEWEGCAAEGNREAAAQFVKEGKLSGYLAYLDGKPIGWCNVNDKKNFARLAEDKDIWNEGVEKAGSIVCFNVAPEYRNRGVASQLLNEICEEYRRAGYHYLEAYPRKGDLSCAEQYHGPKGMYEKAGFVVTTILEGYDIMRKKL